MLQTGGLDINEPALPRQRKRPRRYEFDGASAGDFPEKVEDLYRSIYYEALDLLVCGIKGRFDQPGYKLYSNLETLLVNAANNEKFDEEFKFVVDFYKDDFDADQLRMQLDILSANFPHESVHNLHDVMPYLKEISPVQRSLMSEVCKLASLILVMPATNAVSERSFSALRRLKSYLRSTMTQVRLNNLMLLHVHKSLTDNLSCKDVATDFVSGSSHREAIFGKYD